MKIKFLIFQILLLSTLLIKSEPGIFTSTKNPQNTNNHLFTIDTGKRLLALHIDHINLSKDQQDIELQYQKAKAAAKAKFEAVNIMQQKILSQIVLWEQQYFNDLSWLTNESSNDLITAAQAISQLKHDLQESQADTTQKTHCLNGVLAILNNPAVLHKTLANTVTSEMSDAINFEPTSRFIETIQETANKNRLLVVQKSTAGTSKLTNAGHEFYMIIKQELEQAFFAIKTQQNMIAPLLFLDTTLCQSDNPNNSVVECNTLKDLIGTVDQKFTTATQAICSIPLPELIETVKHATHEKNVCKAALLIKQVELKQKIQQRAIVIADEITKTRGAFAVMATPSSTNSFKIDDKDNITQEVIDRLNAEFANYTKINTPTECNSLPEKSKNLTFSSQQQAEEAITGLPCKPLDILGLSENTSANEIKKRCEELLIKYTTAKIDDEKIAQVINNACNELDSQDINDECKRTQSTVDDFCRCPSGKISKCIEGFTTSSVRCDCGLSDGAIQNQNVPHNHNNCYFQYQLCPCAGARHAGKCDFGPLKTGLYCHCPKYN